MSRLPDRRLLPRDSARLGAELFGEDHVIQWCELLLQGTVAPGHPDFPDIAWLGGKLGWPDYWSRVWGARGLLHLGVANPGIVLESLADPSWRVREMALKVIHAHGIDDPSGKVDPSVDDEVERVRVQAWRALGREDVG